MFSVPLCLLKRRTNYNSTLICIRSVSVCINVSLSVTALLRSVDCIHSPFSRRHINRSLFIRFDLFDSAGLRFLSAAFPGLLFGLLSGHFALGCWFVLRRNFVPLCGVSPHTPQGVLPLDPISAAGHFLRVTPVSVLPMQNAPSTRCRCRRRLQR